MNETRGYPLENAKELQNRSLRFEAYKQFIWWNFQYLHKGNKRVIPSFLVWSIRKLFAEADDSILGLKKVKDIDYMHI